MTEAASTQETTTRDRIVLTVPGSIELRSVVSLVLGGVGSRIDLPYEKVDELQLAVLTLLGTADLESATIEVEIDDESVQVKLGPLPAGASDAPGLRTVLERLVDRVDSVPSDAKGAGDEAGNEEWALLELARPGAASA